MTLSVERDAYYPHSREAVWRALTDSAAIAEWLMPNDFEPRVGHRFTIQSYANPDVGFDGVVRCEVLECEPPSRLVYTWQGGPLDSRVTFRLEREGEGTRLYVEQAGFESPDTPFYKGARAGWVQHLDTLAGVVASLAAKAGER